MTDTLALLFPYLSKTGDIVVRVAVSYMSDQSAPSQNRWFWSYHIRIENHGDEAVQLLARHWKIIDGRGQVHEVRGQGVVGEMPVIAVGESYDYVSGCPLDTSSGEMSGAYVLVGGQGVPFEATISRFPLMAPENPAATSR